MRVRYVDSEKVPERGNGAARVDFDTRWDKKLELRNGLAATEPAVCLDPSPMNAACISCTNLRL